MILMVLRPSGRRSVFVNNCKHFLLQNCWPNQSQILCGASLGSENESLFTATGSLDQDGRHAHIWYKPFKNLFLQNRQADFHKTWFVVSGTQAHYSLSNDDPGVTLTYFTARSNLVTKAFQSEKVKTVDLSENYCSQ